MMDIGNFIQLFKLSIVQIIVWCNIICTYLYFVNVYDVQEILNGVVIPGLTELKVVQIFRLFLKISNQFQTTILTVFAIWLVLAALSHFVLNKMQFKNNIEQHLYGYVMKSIFAYLFVGFMIVGNLILLLSYLCMFIFGKFDLFYGLFIFEIKPLISIWIPFFIATWFCLEQVFERKDPTQEKNNIVN